MAVDVVHEIDWSVLVRNWKDSDRLRGDNPRWFDGKVTWEALVRAEPELLPLKSMLDRIHIPEEFRWQLYSQWKRHLCSLVGFSRDSPGPPFLFSREAYDIAHRKILGRW
jgi:hypothetical protein